jgi:type IV pilus assembly protein PilC
MEPIMILFLGGIVGGVIVAMYLPLFDIIGKVG